MEVQQWLMLLWIQCTRRANKKSYLLMEVVSVANSMLIPFSPQHRDDLRWEKIEESRASVPVTKAVIETGSI